MTLRSIELSGPPPIGYNRPDWMVVLMIVKQAANIHDLRRLARDGKAELVHGEVKLMSQTGGRPARAGGRIYASLLRHEESHGAGWDVDLLGPDVIRSYTRANPDKPAIFRPGQLADAEPAVPGWRLDVDQLLK